MSTWPENMRGDAWEGDGAEATVPDSIRGKVFAAPPKDDGSRYHRRAEPSTNGDGATAATIILDYFKNHYQPAFRRGATVHCAAGDEITMRDACVPNSRVLELLAHASDAPTEHPKHGGGVKLDSLPGFYRKWAPVAWGDLLAELPDEVSAIMADDAPARQTFRRLVADALSTPLTLGTVIRGQKDNAEVTQTEKRSVISWCARLAKPGPWRDVRSYRCWTKLRELGGGEVELQVAIRHELFAQIGADKRLREMGATMFARLAGKYGVGVSSEKERPQGRRAIVLDQDLVSDLTAGIPDEESLPEATDSRAGAEGAAKNAEGASA